MLTFNHAIRPAATDNQPTIVLRSWDDSPHVALSLEHDRFSAQASLTDDEVEGLIDALIDARDQRQAARALEAV